MIHEVVEVGAVLIRHLGTHILQPRIPDFPGIIGAFDVKLLLHA
jgi:hypothetical protein